MGINLSPLINRFKRKKNQQNADADDVGIKVNTDKNDFNVISVNGMRFVTGLEWVNLTSPLNYMQEARQLGKQKGKDIVAIRQGKHIQAGFVSKSEGAAKKGMYSVAIALSEVIKGNFLGAFSLDDQQSRYLIVAVFDGEIISMADSVYDRESAYSTLREVASWCESAASDGQEFDHLYAPPELAFSPEELKLEDILVPAKISKNAKLKQLFFGLSGKDLRALVLLVVVLAGAGYYWYQQQQEKAALQAAMERRKQAELERLREEAKQAELTEAALSVPWVKQPSADSTLEFCVSTLSNARLSLGGWLFDNGKCSMEGEAEWQYRRSEFVTVNDIQQAADRIGLSTVVHLPGDGVSFVFQADPLAVKGDDVDESMDTVLTRFISYFQRINQELSFEEIAHPTLYDEQGNPLPKPQWRGYSFEFQSEMDPKRMLSLLNKDGVRLNMITVQAEDNGSLQWTTKGNIYGD